MITKLRAFRLALAEQNGFNMVHIESQPNLSTNNHKFYSKPKSYDRY